MFLCGEGHFAKQTMERSDFVCVRNGPRSKLFNEKQVWTCLKRSPPARDDIRGFRGQSHLGEGVAALRQAQGPLSLGLAMEARGRLPPPR